MPGKVFISCGQRPPERAAAKIVAKLLKEEFGLAPYIAIEVQSLGDIMAITNELRAADYYLFIDFVRTPSDPTDLPCSLFTHQELALAHHLGFRNQVIAVQEDGAPVQGFLRYMQSNPETFRTTDELVAAIRRLAAERGWNPTYSRNLVVAQAEPVTCAYRDHADVGHVLQKVWQVRIQNRRPDVAAVATVCVLDSISDSSGNEVPCSDRACLKWAGQQGYERTILPEDFGLIDAFAIRADHPGLFLHSARDTPRDPIVERDGDYVLRYKVFAREFPLVEFAYRVRLRWRPVNPATWTTNSTADLI